MLTQLRDYQIKAIDDLAATVKRGNRRPILVMPTGSGKTVVAKEIIDRTVQKGNRVLVLAPRRELIYQTSEHLERGGIEHAMYMAGEERHVMAPVQVASIPTLYRRMKDGRGVPPLADLVVVDEAHLSIAESTQTVLREYSDRVIIGLTATPARGDGRGLGEVYDDLVFGPSVKELTEQGHLVPVRYYAPSKPDLDGVKIQMGDYNAKQLGERMNEPTLIGDVVTNWLRICPDRSTVVFSVNIAHSLALCQEFKRMGVDAAQLDATTPLDDRKEIIRKLHTGDVQVVTNCDVLTYGVDIPRLSCAVIARPTKSLVRYLQGAGRVLRPYGEDEEKKTDTILIDHSGVVDELGWVDEEREWSLDPTKTVSERREAKARSESKPIMCPECMATFTAQRECPECGADLSERYAKHIVSFEAELVEIDRRRKNAMQRKWTNEEKAEFFGELKNYAFQFNYKPGWAAYKYRERFGVWPNAYKDAPPREVSRATESWIRSQQIRYAKRRNREEARAV
jgi:superfamily II DNA or RNA helicase